MMRLAYADPPYPGMAHRYPENTEVDHAALVAHLEADFDGWALSTGSNNLHAVLPLCPPDIRVAAWVKPFASFKPNVNPAYAWEPVIFRQNPRRADRTQATVRDWCAANITLRKGLCGAKPPQFCDWLLGPLNFDPAQDTIEDLFPGTGSLGVAISKMESMANRGLF